MDIDLEIKEEEHIV
jgi:hypothetical protein